MSMQAPQRPQTSEETGNTPSTKKSKWGWIWPEITDAKSAASATKTGYIACLYLAGATMLAIALGAMSKGAFLDAGIFVALAAGIYKKSRVAAVAALTIYLLERIAMMATSGHAGNLVILLFMTAFLVTSVRGTFAYHRYTKPTT